MDICSQFSGENVIDGPVPLDAAHARKGGGHDADTKMRFTLAVESAIFAGTGLAMAGMKVAFIDDGKALGRKCRLKPRLDRGLDGQGSLPSPYEGALGCTCVNHAVAV